MEMNLFKPAATQIVSDKIAFEDRLSVMRVRPNFAGPYRKCPYFRLEEEHVKDKRALVKHIESTCQDWPSGNYYLKMSNGKIFVRFDLLGGKVHNLYERSPITGKEYACTFFLKRAKAKTAN